MNAGAYRERITIERAEVTTDRIGNRTETYSEHYAGYAYVNMLSGTEYWAAAQAHQEDTIRFQMRWHPLLDAVSTTGFRLIWRGKVYNITQVDNVQFRNETVRIRGVYRGKKTV